MTVLRPNTPTIRAEFGGLITASRDLIRHTPKGTIALHGLMGLGLIGLILGLEIWTRSQPAPLSAGINLGLGHGYAHLSMGLLFVVLAARPIHQVWPVPQRIRRELMALTITCHGLLTLRVASALKFDAIDPPLEIALGLGVIALAGLVPLTAPKGSGRRSRPDRWNLVRTLAAPIGLFTGMHALIAIGNASATTGIGLVLAGGTLLLAQLCWPFWNANFERPSAPPGWVGNAVYAHRDQHSRDTRVPSAHPTPINPDPINPNPIDAQARTPEAQPEAQVVKRMRFQAPNFTPIIDYELDPDDGLISQEAEANRRAYSGQHGTLEESIMANLELLDRLEQYAGDANKLSVLYRRSEGERVLRCSLAVNFDPLEDGWTALEVANQILEIVRSFTPRGLKLVRLEIRVYQERFRQGEQRRFERTFSFDLGNLNPPSLELPDQM